MSFISRLPRGVKIAAVAIFAPLAPLVLAIVASLIGDAAGCSVHEGGPSPCLILGVDVGDALYSMFVAAWLSFLILPFASLVLLGGVILTVYDILQKRKR
jgi:hypothetical protein